jgi:hypothetical protein
MKFEYDLNKSDSNQKKHGISLEKAKALWFGPYVEIAARTLDEPRFMIIGKLNTVFYSCIYTTRGEDVIRLISARRSRKSEEAIYYEYIKR